MAQMIGKSLLGADNSPLSQVFMLADFLLGSQVLALYLL